MKRSQKLSLLVLTLLPLTSSVVWAQQEPFHPELSLAERIGIIKEKQDRFELYIHTHFSGELQLDKRENQPRAAFRMPQLRIETKVQLNDWLSFRWRQRLNKSNRADQHIDDLPNSIDIAGLGIKPSEKWSLFIGKQTATPGGFEYDLNPIEVYEFSNMGEHMTPYLTGVKASYQPHPNHQIQLEVLNSRNASFEATYPRVSGVTEVALPFVYTINWNGHLSPTLSTRWSYTFLPQGTKEGKAYNMHYIALGNRLHVGPFDSYLDIMYANEGLNRKGIIPHPYHTEYLSLVLELKYRIHPQWQLFFKGMYETAGAANATKEGNKERPIAYPKVLTSYGYIGGIEYYPIDGENLHFFLTYIGRSHRHIEPEKSGDNHRLSLGFIYQIPLF